MDISHFSIYYSRPSLKMRFLFLFDVFQDDGSTFDIVPNSQFIVSRTAFVDNSSKYHVDSKVVSRAEVVDLLKKHGIDMDNNRFLILQGEVEHIATMKPKAANPGDDNGLLEYLEDIIGSNKFVEPIAVATKELEGLGIERTRRLNRLRIVEKEKIQLEAAKVQAEEHISKQKSSYDKKALLYQHERYRVKLEAEAVEQRRHELMSQQQEQRKAKEERDSEVRELEQKVAAQSKEVAAAMKKLEKVKAKLKGYENEDVTLQDATKNLQQKQKKLEKTTKSETEKIEEKEALIEKLTKEKAELEETIASSEKKADALQEKLTELRQKMSKVLAPLHEQLAAKQRVLMPFQETITASEAKLDLLRSKCASSQKRVDDAVASERLVKSQIADATSKLAESKKAYEKSAKELEEKSAKLTQFEADVATLKAEDAKLSQQIITTRSSIDEAARTKTSSGLLANLRKHLPANVQSGILGKLGELGTIDERYDTAVTTACGALENIVVINTETAQSCVEVLKSKRLGRATFIILHEIRETEKAMKAAFDVPANAHRLFDLITADSEEARVAFYHALSDTLVCDDIATASSLYKANKKRRIVTLNGALYESNGTLSGGGQYRASGGMRVSKGGAAAAGSGKASSSAAQAVDVNALKAELENLTAQIKVIREELGRTETHAAQLRSQVAKLTRESESFRADVEGGAPAIKALESSLEELKEERVQRERELKQAESETAKDTKKIEKELEDARAGAESSEAEIAKIQKKIDEASGVELRDAEVSHAALMTKMDEWIATVTKHGVQMTSATKAIAKSKEALERAGEETKSLEEEMQKTRESLKRLTEDALAATEHLEEATRLANEENAKLKEFQDQLESVSNAAHSSKEADFASAEALKEVELTWNEQRELIRVLSAKLEEVAKKKLELRVDENDEEEEATCLLPTITDEELAQLDDRELKAIKLEINRLQAELDGQLLNIQAIIDFREKLKVWTEHKREVDEINGQFEAKHQELDSLRKQRLDMFMEGHSKINPKLKEMYTMITISGSADLEIANSTDPFLDGITFSVRPPNKSWRPIQNLSGGEKTLSSLALVFALHYYKPTPLYVMDEIDAALDFKNVSIVANYIKERTKDAQFLIVSLRNFMFELADRLVGIYKTDNATKSVTINPNAFALESK